MSNSWTQSLEIINIPKETKTEIVKTLVAYPLVLDKLYLKDNLLESSNKINLLYENQLTVKDAQLLNLSAQIKALESEKKLFKTQLRKQKGKSLKIGGVGLLVIASIILLNN